MSYDTPGQVVRIIVRNHQRTDREIQRRLLRDPKPVPPDAFLSNTPVREPRDVTAQLPLSLAQIDQVQAGLTLWLEQPNPVAQRQSIIRGLKHINMDAAVRLEVQRRAIELSAYEDDRRFWADPAGHAHRQDVRAYKSLTPDRALEQMDARRQRLKHKVTPPELVWCVETTSDDLHLDDIDDPEAELSKALAELFEKGAGHKYLKRVPTGKKKPKYRYYYKIPKKKGLTASEDLKAGAKFRVKHAGQEGHFEVLGHDKTKGTVRVKHDESGRTAHIRERDLHRMIQSYHRAKTTPEAIKLRIQATQARLPRTGAPKTSDKPPTPPRPPRDVRVGTLGDLTSGVYDRIEGFGTEEQARGLAEGLADDRRYVVIKQPTGFVLASGSRREPLAGGAREGNGTDLFFRGTGRKLDKHKGQWLLVDADDLVASHDAMTFQPRGEYPADVQERAYHEQKGEQSKVATLAQTLEPAMLVNDNPDAVNGAPIVVEHKGKLVVLGGNGRTMGVQRAYGQNLETGAALKRHLATRAHAYGFTAADVRALKAPMLVRKMTPKGGDTDDLRNLGRRMNEAFTQGLDARAEEVALGKAYVNQDVLHSLAAGIGEDQTLADYLASPKSADFVSALFRAGLVDEVNATKFVDQKTKLLNEDGRARIERVLAARVVPDASLLNRMLPSHREHLARSTAALVSAESHGWDLRPRIEAAVRADIDLRGKRGGGKAATRDYLAQLEDTTSSTVATRVQTDPVARALFVALRHHGGNSKTPAAFRGVALRAKQASVDGGALGLALPGFSVEPMKPEHAIAAEFGIGDEWMGGSERLAASLTASWRKSDDLERPNRLVNRALWLTRELVESHTGAATGAGRHPILPVGKISSTVLRDLRRAVKADKELAADQAAAKVTDQTVRGWVEVFARQHAQQLAKALGCSIVRMALAKSETPRNGVQRGETLYKRVKTPANQLDLLSWRPEAETKIDDSIEAMERVHATLDSLTSQFVSPWDLQQWAPAFKTHADLVSAAKLMVQVGQKGAHARDAYEGDKPTEAVAQFLADKPPKGIVSSGGKPSATVSGSVKRPALVVARGGPRPSGAGWGPIPGGRRGGYRRRRGQKFEYWYPDKAPTQRKHSVPGKPRKVERQADVTDVMSAKRTKGARKAENERALEIVQKAAREGRGLTDAEAVQVASYTGKGGISGDLNQFYTRTDVAQAMWDIIGAYQDGVARVLEPSCGSGVFLQTAPKGAKVTGVELDPQAAAISSALHGHKHEIEGKAFEEFSIERIGQKQDYDAVIANPPYCTRTGDIPRHKPEYRSADHYFIDTSIDHLKPGGTAAFLIHPGVMNNKNPTYRDFRERLLARCEVLDAFRLPDDAFKHVHCEISADIMILRKRDDLVGQTLLEAVRSEDEGARPALESLGAWDQQWVDGHYFDKHPERILGKALTAEDTGWRATVEGDITKVPAALKRLTEEKIAGEKDAAAIPVTLEALTDSFETHPELKEYMARAEAKIKEINTPAKVGDVEVFAQQRYLYIGDPPRWRLMESVDDVSQIIEQSGDEAAKDAHEIAKDIQDLLAARDEGDFYKARSLRRAAADRVKAWVADHGIPRSHKALAELSRSAPILLDFLACVDSNGELSDVLSKDAAITLKSADVDRTDLLSVARHIAARNAGYITPADIQHNWEGWDGHGDSQLREMLLSSGEFAEDTLARVGAEAPIQHIEDYLTGNLYDKLDAELARLETLKEGTTERSQVERQVIALRDRLQTKWRSLDDVPIQLRVLGWLPLKFLNAYLNSQEGRERVFGLKKPPGENTPLLEMSYDKGMYTLHEISPPAGAKTSGWVDGRYQTVDVEPGASMGHSSDGHNFLLYMNRLRLKKYQVENVEKDIEAHFGEWLKESDYRTEAEEIYNRTFNGEFRREYSGEALPLEGMTEGIVPHDYQNQAVRWAAETGRGILGQDVGLGKTFIAILLARLRKQQGKAKRPMVVVPKSVATNWAEEVETLFPGSRVLVIGEHKTRKGVASDSLQQRNEKLAEIKQNEYDLIICTKPAFDQIPLSHETIGKYEEDDFWYQRAGQVDNIETNSKTQQTKDKRIEKLKAEWASDKLQQKFKHAEAMVYWEDLGIDTLMADEAHCFPAGTLIDGKPIENYQEGDTVRAYDHATGKIVKGRVANLQTRTPKDLYRLSLSDGTQITCTGKHPFFTSDGYVFAKDILVGETLYKNEQDSNMQLVRGEADADEGAAMASSAGAEAVLLQQVPRDAVEAGNAGDSGADRIGISEGDTSSASGGIPGTSTAGRLPQHAGGAGQGESYAARDGLQTPDPGGQWPTGPSSAEASPPATRGGLGTGVCEENANGSVQGVSDALQNRHRKSEAADSGRSGRQIAPIAYPAGPGPEEGRILAPVRVDRVEVFKPTGDGTFGGLCPRGVVYNIEVETHHNYFAHDILVHNSYKNLYAARKRFGKNPKFLGGSGQSKTARKMQHMSRFVRESNPSHGVYLLTATPTKNSPLEVFNMLQHVAPDAFHAIGIKNSEEFIDRFCQLQERLILTPPGKGGTKKDAEEHDDQFADEFEGAGNMESAQCVTGFTNLKELEQVMDRYMMLQTATDVGLRLPESDHQTHLVDMTAEQQAIYADLRNNARTLDKDEDPGGMFRILDQMKKAAQDLGLYDPDTYSDWYTKSPKYKACVDSAYQGAVDRGGQIVFCDHNASHERIKAMLVSKGLQPEEIGIINAAVAKDSAARQQIGNAFNRGELKVVIGNTGTMGEGVNLQGKKHERGTTDIHHLDQPWDPGTMHQRNGRGVRQGNPAEQVQVHTYLAKGSFDGFRHSTLKGKERWLDKLRSGADNISNDMEGQDVDDAEMLAMLSDDPEGAMAKIKSQRASAENAWYLRQAQESIDNYYAFQRKQQRLKRLKGQEETRLRLTADIDRLKRSLLRNELLPRELKAHIETGDTHPVAVSTYIDGEGDDSRFAAHLIREGSVIKSTGGNKYVVEKVDLKNRNVKTRHWGRTYDTDVPIAKIGVEYKATKHTLVDELKSALSDDEYSASYRSPAARIGHISPDVLEANRDMIDAAMRDWYEEHGQGLKVLARTDKGIEAVEYKVLFDRPIVHPFGAERDEIISAAAAANQESHWEDLSNYILQTGSAEYGESGYAAGGLFQGIAEEAKKRWEEAHA